MLDGFAGAGLDHMSEAKGVNRPSPPLKIALFVLKLISNFTWGREGLGTRLAIGIR